MNKFLSLLGLFAATFAYGLGSASRYSFPTYNFADGVYMVRLVTENDGVVSYKMSVMNR